MATTNIDSIATSLRNFSLNSARGNDPHHQTENKELFYASIEDCSYYSSDEFDSDDAGRDIEDEEDNDGDIEDCSSYGSSSADSDAGGENGGAGGIILVVAGCKSCFMYFMVPKLLEDCPKCGDSLLHFD